MYTLKVSYGYVDEPAMATAEILGTYESLDEACEAAKSKFDAIKERLADPETCYGETEGSQYDYYDAIGDHTVEFGRVFSGVDYYCEVRVAEILSNQTPQQGGR